MFKKLLATLAAVCLSGALAYSSNLSLFTASGSGCNEASQLLSCINQLIVQINAGVGGLNNAQTAAASTTATTAETTLQTYTLPASFLSTAGQSLRVTCWGTTGANGNNKTMKLYFGSTTVATPAAATNAKGWSLSYIVMRRTATTQGFDGTGVVDVTPVSPSVTDAAETLSGGIVIKCTGTNGTASATDITANGMIVESIK